MGILIATASAQQPRQAPDFRQRPMGGGEEVVLNQLRGRPVVLLFWANH
ncbi:MAG: redoxin domain-containing protein [Armatimonadetes bacterium]|nr:redoxin domain-containing protein [Armatimonadota bacterium]